jgi:uncharacterized caspase-like protein
MRSIRRCKQLVFFLLIGMFTLPVIAVESPARYALVIGNSAYQERPLSNPASDAGLIAETLMGLGFNISQAQNLDRKAMFAKVRAFYQQLPQGATALIYYAGHGVQIGGANYLIPIDMTLTSERGMALKAYPVKELLNSSAKAKSAVNIVILDACRNNPFQPQTKTRSFDNLGLARITSPKGTLIAYSTAPGQLAEDGLGRVHSFYTETLAAELGKPGIPVEAMLKQVADIVRKKTLDDQQPWYESSLVDEFYFTPPAGVKIAAAKPPVRIAKNSTARNSRSLDSKKANPNQNSDWYMKLSADEWSQLDWNVMQRVKRLTRDEIPLLEQKAKAGNVVAMTTLGVAYHDGLDKITESGGTNTYRSETSRTFRSGSNNTKSIEWLSMAAHAGFPMAQVELGEMYYQAQGVDRDIKESIRWLELAARADYPRARLNLVQAKAVDNPTPESMQSVADELYKNIKEVMKKQPSDYE